MRLTLRISLGLVAVLLVAIVLGVNYAVDNILPYSPIRPHRCTVQEMQKYQPNLLSPADFTSHWHEFDITVEDSIRLKGWFIQSVVQPARGTVLVLHGIASTRIAMLSTARLLCQNGFNCILYDSRANGESGGLNCTFGYYEKYDVSSYLDSALARYPNSPPFAVLGDSFGAAVAIQALAIDKRLVCGIAESPFATLRQVIHDYFREMFYVPLDCIPDAALKRSERIAHFAVDSVSPVEDARRILQPVLIVHGESDSKISMKYGTEVFASLSSPNKELYLIPGAGHDDLAQVGGVEYQHRILAFLDRYLK